MNNSIYDIDFTRALPESLKNDSNILALGQAISKELQKNIRLSRTATIYARFNELSDDILDILAHDLHVDWYEDTYSVEAKRQVIKDSVKVHKRLGTKYAMTEALGDVFPSTEVQEWFEYGGTPYHFRIILDFTSAKEPADFMQILRTQEFYKRLTTRLDEIIVQMSASIEVKIEATHYHYVQGMTGTYAAGEKPHKNTSGGVAFGNVKIHTGNEFYGFFSPQAGTKPRRNITGGCVSDGLYPVATAETFLYSSKRCGTTKTN